MKSVVLRPLAVFTIAFYIFGCIEFAADTTVRAVSAAILFVLLSLSFVSLGIVKKRTENIMARKTAIAAILLCAGAFLASVYSFVTFDVVQKSYEEEWNSSFDVNAEITEVVWDGGYSGIYIARMKEPESISFVLESVGGIEAGSEVFGEMTFSPLEDGEDFNERRYYLSRGVVLSAEAEELTVKESDEISLSSVARLIRDKLSKIFTDLMSKEEGGFAAALLFGDEKFLSDEVSRDFRRLGIVHVLAISGMHLTVLCAFVSKLVEFLGKKAQYIACIVTVVFYLFITGFSGAVTRSAVMVILMIAASFIGRSSDGFINLGISVFAITALDSYAFADVGLQLSFFAVLAIFLFDNKPKKLVKGMKEKDLKGQNGIVGKLRELISSFVEGMILTVIIVMLMLPLEWYYFRELSIISPVTSPLFSVVGDVLLWGLPVLLIFSPAPTFASALSFVLRWMINLICTVADHLSHIENVSISLNYPLAGIFSIVVMIGVIAFCVLKGKKRFVSLIVLTCIVISYAGFCQYVSLPDRDRVGIIPIEYKNNDGMLISSGKKTAIIDVGNGYTGVIYEGISAIDKFRSTEIEALVLTHLHRAYISSVEKALQNVIIRKVYIPAGDELSDALVLLCRQYRAESMIYEYGDVISLNDAEIRIDEPLYMDRSVQPVISFTVSAYEEKLLYLGAGYKEAGGVIPDDADMVWYGGHGPLYQSKFFAKDRLSFASNAATGYIEDEYKPVSSVDRIYLGKTEDKVIFNKKEKED